MAQPATVFDETDEAIEEAACLVANAQIDAGDGLSHEIVGEWLQQLARGERGPPIFLKSPTTSLKD